jgi:tetratricopeptide (TPR) repeat protein
MKWVELTPKPRPRPEPADPFGATSIEWDVFLSYRSSNRQWAMALRDQLVEANFRVFLDQFALLPGQELDASLDEYLSRSGSGVLVLSKDVASSDWVQNERRKMEKLRAERQGSALPFNFVIARIDSTSLPFTQLGAVYSDFSSGYEDGPRGAELVRLVHGLIGAPVSESAVRTLVKADEETAELLLEVAAAAQNKQPAEIVALATSAHPVLRESPVVAIAAAQALISARDPERALEVARFARVTFPRSLRLQQLEGLALRRLGRIEEAQKILAKLYVAGHRDPETLGIYGATWMARYKKSGDNADLERSRQLYLDAFRLSPKDEYVGINAASKSALLGEVDVARQIAGQIKALTVKFADGSDFYKALSLAEALVLLGEYPLAAKIYREGRARHPERSGDLATTIEQVDALIEALKVPDDSAKALRQALGAS